MEKRYKDYGKSAGTAVAIATPLLATTRYALQKNMDKDFPDSPLQIIGATAASYGAAMPFFSESNRRDKISAGLVGIGLSSMFVPYIDFPQLFGWAKKKLSGLGLPITGNEIDVHVQDIPRWWGRSKSYKKLAKLLRKFVVEDTYNRQLKQKIMAGYKHPSVIQVTRQILAAKKISVYNPIDVAKAITDWCWHNITYVFDPEGPDNDEDTYTHPYLLLQDYHKQGFASGDCDDSAILIASMLMSVGLTPRFILWAQDQNKPDVYTHITCALYEPDEKWKPFMTHWPYFNIEPTMKPWENAAVSYDFWPKHFRKAVIPITK